MSSRSSGLFEPMTLQPGDPVRLTREQAAVRSASARARRNCPIRIGMVQKIRRHSPRAYVIWGDNRHADQEQICVLEKIYRRKAMDAPDVASQLAAATPKLHG